MPGNHCLICNDEIPCAESAHLVCGKCACQIPVEGNIFPRCEALAKRLAVAEKLFNDWLMNEHNHVFQSSRLQNATKIFLSNQPGEYVAVNLKFLDDVAKLSVELYDLAGKLDLFETRAVAHKMNCEVQELKAALEKEPG